jgi:hypothetical protein
LGGLVGVEPSEEVWAPLVTEEPAGLARRPKVCVPFEDLGHDDPIAQLARDRFADQQSPSLITFTLVF